MNVTTAPVTLPAPDVVITLSPDEALLLRRTLTSQSPHDVVRKIYNTSNRLDPMPQMGERVAAERLYALGSLLQELER